MESIIFSSLRHPILSFDQCRHSGVFFRFLQWQISIDACIDLPCFNQFLELERVVEHITAGALITVNT